MRVPDVRADRQGPSDRTAYSPERTTAPVQDTRPRLFKQDPSRFFQDEPLPPDLKRRDAVASRP